MTTESSNRDPASGTNTGPIDPEVLKRIKDASDPEPSLARRDESKKADGPIDPDAPARGVLFPDEDAPEPNEPA